MIQLRLIPQAEHKGTLTLNALKLVPSSAQVELTINSRLYGKAYKINSEVANIVRPYNTFLDIYSKSGRGRETANGLSFRQFQKSAILAAWESFEIWP